MRWLKDVNDDIYDPNDPNVGPIFVNDQGQACLNYGGSATNCSINLASFTSAPLDAYTPYTQQYNITIQRELWNGWAVENGGCVRTETSENGRWVRADRRSRA